MGPRSSRVSGGLGSSVGREQDEAGVPCDRVGRGRGENAGMEARCPYLPSLPFTNGY